MLEKNRTNAEETLLSAAAREGLALLQGLLLCARCGRRLSVRYKGNGGIYPTYDCNRLRREGLATSSCINTRCDPLDAAVSLRVLEVLQPAHIELAAQALREIESRDQALSRQWQMRIERAEYEAQLAERRYEEADPLCVDARYVVFNRETVFWRSPHLIPRPHNYSDLRKAINPAS